MTERLNRYLSRSGVASRRAADRLIATGSVLVNGERPPPGGRLVDPATDLVTVDGTEIRPPAVLTYIAANKPEGYIVSAADPGSRPTVFSLVETDARLFAVGRLDMDSRGLLLLTDDGELAHRLAHPRYEVRKEYSVVVEGTVRQAELRRLRAGVDLDDGPTQPAQVDLLDVRRGRSRLLVSITEGRNRQVRRMLEALGHRIVDLQRTAYGPIRLGRLREGGWRRLRDAEVAALRDVAGLG